MISYANQEIRNPQNLGHKLLCMVELDLEGLGVWYACVNYKL